MRLLYVACLHNPEHHERWLIKHFRNRGVEVFPFDYRMVHVTTDANSQLLTIVRSLNIDKVFIVKGEHITKETIQTLNEMGITTACWMLDDQENSKFYDCPYSHIFTTSPRLIEKHKQRCGHVYELASYIEPTIFQLDETSHQSPDVSFLGTKYPGREEKITYLRDHGCPVEVYGDQWTIPNKGRLSEYHDCIRLWRHSKVNLNIHQEKCRDVGSVNLKCFEIPASGGFMLVDYFSEILEKFASDEVALYNWDDDGGLLKAVKYWLDDPEGRNEVVRRARERILRDHTAERRVDFILSKL